LLHRPWPPAPRVDHAPAGTNSVRFARHLPERQQGSFPDRTCRPRAANPRAGLLRGFRFMACGLQTPQASVPTKRYWAAQLSTNSDVVKANGRT
jgi:hypothetical protein